MRKIPNFAVVLKGIRSSSEQFERYIAERVLAERAMDRLAEEITRYAHLREGMARSGHEGGPRG